MQNRAPKQLLLAFLGEFVLDRHDDPLRASVILEVMEGAGVAAPATRATLDRMTSRGLLQRRRRGREIEFELTREAEAVLREGGQRVHGANPFAPSGEGWTLVTFTLSEGQRTLRHRLRAALTWAGFAPLRDGLWLLSLNPRRPGDAHDECERRRDRHHPGERDRVLGARHPARKRAENWILRQCHDENARQQREHHAAVVPAPR